MLLANSHARCSCHFTGKRCSTKPCLPPPAQLCPESLHTFAGCPAAVAGSGCQHNPHPRCCTGGRLQFHWRISCCRHPSWLVRGRPQRRRCITCRPPKRQTAMCTVRACLQLCRQPKPTATLNWHGSSATVQQRHHLHGLPAASRAHFAPDSTQRGAGRPAPASTAPAPAVPVLRAAGGVGPSTCRLWARCHSQWLCGYIQSAAYQSCPCCCGAVRRHSVFEAVIRARMRRCSTGGGSVLGSQAVCDEARRLVLGGEFRTLTFSSHSSGGRGLLCRKQPGELPSPKTMCI